MSPPGRISLDSGRRAYLVPRYLASGYLTTYCIFCSVFNVLDTNQLSTERRMVLDLYEQGKTPREIAAALKVSTQRVYQQLAKLGLSPSKQKGKAS